MIDARTTRHSVGAAALIAASIVGPALASVIHVDADAAPGGDGTTWSTAYRDLQDGLAAAVGTTNEIWVAEGTYRPDRGSGSRSKSFHLLPGVTIRGGFAGTESTAEERVIALHPTILSGDLLANDQPEFVNVFDNSYHVLTAINLATAATLDGLVVRGGNASGYFIYDRGAGLFSLNSSVHAVACQFESHRATNGAGMDLANSELLFDGCTLSGCMATYGAGIRASGSTLTMTSATIVDNVSLFWGGGVDCTDGDLTVDGGVISNNLAPRQAIVRVVGGRLTLSDVVLRENAILASEVSGDSLMHVETATGPLLMSNCEFTDNHGSLLWTDAPLTVLESTFKGNVGVNCMLRVESAGCDASDTSFEGNSASFGFGGVLWADGAIGVTNCEFVNNSGSAGAAIRSGGNLSLSDSSIRGNGIGAVSIVGSNAHIEVARCEFIGNSGTSGLAAALSTGSFSNGSIEDCLFEENAGGESALNGGGEIYVRRCDFRYNNVSGFVGTIRLISECDFVGNTFIQGAGAMIFGGPSFPPTYLINCRFILNHSTSTALNSGSGALCVAGVGNGNGAIVINPLFVGNAAALYGGGAFCLGGTMDLINGTFYANSSELLGGGVYAYKGTTRIRNGLLWSNGGFSEGEQVAKGNGTLIVSSSSVQGWTGSLGGTANNGLDPLFADLLGPDQLPGTEDDDLTLSAGSPAINTGSSVFLPADLFDVDGDGNVAEPMPIDLAGLPRVVTLIDRGAFEKPIKADAGHVRPQTATGATARPSPGHRSSATSRTHQ